MHKPQLSIELPAPTGLFSVGTTEYHLIDKKRKEVRSLNPNDCRELMINVWYPIDRSIKGKPFPYLSQIMPHVTTVISQQSNTSLEKLSYLNAPIKTHSIFNSPISASRARYPVIVFSHGMQSYVTRSYTSLLEDLASHGYIVVAIDHPYDNFATLFPNGKIITPKDAKPPFFDRPVPTDEAQKAKILADDLAITMDVWVRDSQFVIDELEKINKHDPQQILTSKLDLSHIGIFGHSFGGAAAAQMCRKDSRCKVGIDIDGTLYGKDNEAPFNKPFMFLMASKSFELGNYPPDEMLAKMHMTKAEVDKSVIATQQSMENLFNNISNDAYFVLFKTADHATFSDFNLLMPMQDSGIIAPLKGIEIARKLVVDFFDVYLKGSDRTTFITMLKNLPEITEKIKIRK